MFSLMSSNTVFYIDVPIKASQSGSHEFTPAFTELLISARLKSIAVKLYFKDNNLVRSIQSLYASLYVI